MLLMQPVPTIEQFVMVFTFITIIIEMNTSMFVVLNKRVMIIQQVFVSIITAQCVQSEINFVLAYVTIHNRNIAPVATILYTVLTILHYQTVLLPLPCGLVRYSTSPQQRQQQCLPVVVVQFRIAQQILIAVDLVRWNANAIDITKRMFMVHVLILMLHRSVATVVQYKVNVNMIQIVVNVNVQR